MLKLNKEGKSVFRMQDMQPGQIGIVRNSPVESYEGIIVYCFGYNNLKWCVALNEPDSVWSGIEHNTIEVELLKPGEMLEVTSN